MMFLKPFAGVWGLVIGGTAWGSRAMAFDHDHHRFPEIFQRPVHDSGADYAGLFSSRSKPRMLARIEYTEYDRALNRSSPASP